ncbi:LOW QUALITY PROTEIN: alpha-sarcoglycan [Corvus cornix cornix]|uniref:LOW QUALITY PROTEIN: alpha-sarcoglycan n=1 Tax=Corvus cornix cornix TaxID=932674 RepID=UPI00194E687C|nr:LOW QUALITY PROTEIN: alpha-sarcoglycan [Corvus cornix cornix]
MEGPELLRLWVLAALALGGSQATVLDHHVLPDLRLSAETGAIFVHELERELFLETFPGSEDDDAPVTFRAHLWDHPDLPRWLRFAQRDPGQPGFLYGCPLAPELGTHSIQVLAYNRHTFATVSQRLLISVTPAPGGDALFQAEFLVGNRNVEELLPEAAREMFLQASAGVWERGDLHIINVTSALDRGGRVPLPIEGRREGVYVQVGSHSPFSPCLASAVSPQSRSRCHRGQRPLASCYDTFAPHFSIRWCNLTLLQVWPSPTTPGPLWGSGVLEDGGGFEPPTEVVPRELLPGFLVTLLVPLAVAALLCLLLGHLMCCRREGVEKRDLQTSDIQLVHHSSIHGDTRELRLMAGSRDVPRPLSTLPMFNVRTGQRINPMPGPRDGARVPLLPQ